MPDVFDPYAKPEAEVRLDEEVIEERDPLKLELEDEDLVEVIDQKVKLAKRFYKEKKIPERQGINENFLFGRQIDEKKLKTYGVPFVDNVIYESEGSIKPIALSTLPDLTVKPGNDTSQSKDNAERLSKILNTDIRKRENRIVLGTAFKHHPVYFIGAIKYRWDPEKGRDGDYVFEVIHPQNLILDHTARSNNPNEMDYIIQKVPMSVKEAIMRFPDKETELLGALSFEKMKGTREQKLATEIKIQEVWFTWYKKQGDKWERIEAVAWKFRKVILKKMRNPNWDWEGERHLFSYDEEISEEGLRGAMMAGEEIPGLRTETVFRNYFENPEKPFILMGYDQFGKMPYDETSRIEQSISPQKQLNKQGRQIVEMTDKAGGKEVFSEESGLKAEDIQELDMNDPDQDILVEGSVREVHDHIDGVLPTAPLFTNQNYQKDRIYSIMHVHSTTRGEKETDVATLGQILREADYGAIDDLKTETIDAAALGMARGAVQLIKLRYTEDHMRALLGREGKVTFESINQDLVEDGMELIVSASSVDKMLRKRQAAVMAQSKFIDPLTFYEDLEVPNPKERLKRLMMFNSNPDQYTAEYAFEEGEQRGMTAGMAGRLGGDQDATMAIAQLQEGQTPTPPENVSGEYVQAITQFLQSGEFQALPDEIKTNALNFARGLVQTQRV